MTDPSVFRAGEQWTYRVVAGYAASRLMIGAVVTFNTGEPIVCCAVTGAPRQLPDGTIDTVVIPFLPMRASALLQTVIARDGAADLPSAFGEAFASWHDDPRGLSAFTVPFDGRLDLMIARQMKEIIAGSVE
jgi:hypothetical protein